jgi:uncharacterized lipoprotein
MVGTRPVSRIGMTIVLGSLVALGLSACASGARDSTQTPAYRWDPSREECRPLPKLTRPAKGHWLIDFGGYAATSNRSARRLGASSPVGSPSQKVAIVVITPRAAIYQATEVVLPNAMHFVLWPRSFVGAGRQSTIGTYTVLWKDLSTRAWIGCAGFTVK